MNSQQAINLLKNAEQYLDEYCELNDEVKAAFCMARTALELFENSEQLPYAQLEKRTEKRTETHGVCLDAISRQMAIDEIDVWIEAFKENGHRESASDAHFIRGGIGALPPAHPEIIRCKDCKHYQFADNRAFGMPVKMCKWFGFEDVDDDDFCSRAERR